MFMLPKSDQTYVQDLQSIFQRSGPRGKKVMIFISKMPRSILITSSLSKTNE